MSRRGIISASVRTSIELQLAEVFGSQRAASMAKKICNDVRECVTK